MPDRMFYIEGSWLTYEQAHSLGYSLLPQRLVTFYSVSNDSVVIKQDSGDNTYYDSVNHTWVVDFADLNLYKKVRNKTFYRGESSADYRCYISSITESTPNYLFYNSLIRTLSDAYEKYGITSYECKNIILDSSGLPIVWFDSTTSKYFDDRDGFHRWVDSIGDEKVIMYDSSATESSQIYENEAADYFYIDDSFISRSEFYTHDNYGVVRENVYVLKDDEVYGTYYDSYSDEYCIPEVTEIWISKDDLLELGYIFVDGIADMWLCETPLHLPWKYLPSSATLSFTNTSHSDLPITLPEDREASIGSEIVLPEITGVYTDANSIRWVATRWNIGEFNSTFILNENTVADLECEKVKVTLSFVNAYYQTLEIPLPDPRTVDNGDLVTLPSVTGEYEDEDHIKWYPLRWDIGEFGSSYLLSNDTSAVILCERLHVTLSFTNLTKPELDIALPETMHRYYGDDILLPALSGLYRDEDGYGYRPIRYDIGAFNTLYRTYVDTVADVVWEQIIEMRDNAITGYMPGEDVKLVSDGIMIYSPIECPPTPWLYNPEIDGLMLFGGRIKKWDSSYEDHYIVFPEKQDTEPEGQFIGGTIRSRGNLENRNIEFECFPSRVSEGIYEYTPLPSTPKSWLYNPEIDNLDQFTGRTKKWDSSYTDHIVIFPEKPDYETYEQAATGTIRKRGNLANRFILFTDVELSGIVNYAPLPAVAKPWLYNPEIDNLTAFTGKIKKHDPTWVFPPAPVFPEKDDREPEGQFIGGTYRVKGNLANREIPIDGLFGLGHIS